MDSCRRAGPRRGCQPADERPLAPDGSNARSGAGAWRWLRSRYTKPAAWRELGYTIVVVTVVPVAYAAVAAVPVLAGILIASPLLAAGGHGPRLADAFETERRRIERDLHDGAQQRLVSVTMQLGLARLDLPPHSPAAAAVADAHQQAKQLMADLRELIQGIHPRVLADRGLPAALDELADRCQVPVTVHRGCRRQARRPHLRQTPPPLTDDTNRRVLAVLTYLRATKNPITLDQLPESSTSGAPGPDRGDDTDDHAGDACHRQHQVQRVEDQKPSHGPLANLAELPDHRSGTHQQKTRPHPPVCQAL
jgi:hypothetical protein